MLGIISNFPAASRGRSGKTRDQYPKELEASQAKRPGAEKARSLLNKSRGLSLTANDVVQVNRVSEAKAIAGAVEGGKEKISAIPVVKIVGIDCQDAVATCGGKDRDVDRDDREPQRHGASVRLDRIGKITGALGKVVSAALESLKPGGRIAGDTRKPDLDSSTGR
ncbi:hypothetical protein LTR78_003869 [Recurvomyces mirabilis]|uniref:Uncharacterized protein n=1 Tax=Recurvomyces mirabilis TaxID=574656 RepID=A0AAE0WQU3_9PEZI|nr:hypothetical protein LTR78_003869 [Recurvomyces mirabilis]KAK5153992.1 hypothetical protein LTS14_007212 [Recurvomyces mirabilis]